MVAIKKSAFLVGLIFNVAAFSNASATGVMEAYYAALKNDPQYRSAVADNEAGQEYKNIGRSGLLPTVQYSYSTSKNKGDQTYRNISSNLDYTSVSSNVSLRQVIFSMDAYARYKQGKVQTQQTEAIFVSKSADLIVRLFSAYADAKFAEEQLVLLQAQRNTLAEQLRMNQQMLKKGEGTRTDTLETQAKLDVAEAQVIEAEDNLTAMRNQLQSIVGIEIKALDKLGDRFDLMKLAPTKFEEWEQMARDNNPELLAARHALESAELEITKSKAGHSPRLDLNASYSKSSSESISTISQDTNLRSIGVQLVVPIYSGGYVNAVSNQAVAGRDKARSDLDGANKRVVNELNKQFNAMNSGAKKMQALEKSVESATLLVDATSKSIKAGVRINVDLLNAQQQLTAAKRDLAQARYTYLLSYLRMKAAAGTLNQDDLQQVAAYFKA